MLEIDSLINMRMMGILSDEEVLIVINKFRADCGLVPLTLLPIELLQIFRGLNETEEEHDV